MDRNRRLRTLSVAGAALGGVMAYVLFAPTSACPSLSRAFAPLARGMVTAFLPTWLSVRIPLSRRQRIGAACFAGAAFLAAQWPDIVGVLLFGQHLSYLSFPFLSFTELLPVLPAAVYGVFASAYLKGSATWTQWAKCAGIGAGGALASGLAVGLIFGGFLVGLGLVKGKGVEYILALPISGVIGGYVSLPGVPFGIAAAALTSWLSDEPPSPAVDTADATQ